MSPVPGNSEPGRWFSRYRRSASDRGLAGPHGSWGAGRVPWLVILGLMTALAVSLTARQFGTAIPDAELGARQQAIVERALEYVRTDFVSRAERLMLQARQLATRSDIMGGLRHLGDDPQTAVEALVVSMAALPVNDLQSVEIYDPTPRVRAWNGFSMPLDRAPEEMAFLSTPQLRLSVDGDQRAALVAWYPVRFNGEVVGAVRVMELIRVRVPVRNEFLSDVSLAEDWSTDTGLDVKVFYDDSVVEGRTPISDDQGKHLLSVAVLPPAQTELVRSATARYDDVIALLIWLIGLWGTWFALWRLRLLSRTGVLLPGVHGIGVVSVLLLLRVLMLWLRVPARWQEAKAPLAPLFDPTHLASDLGWGLFGSTGDLAITALFAVWAAIALLRTGPGERRRSQGAADASAAPTDQGLALAAHEQAASLRAHGAFRAPASARGAHWQGLTFGVVSGVLFGVVALVARQLLLDSTLDYFARSGLLPQRLVAVVFAALLLLLVAAGLGSLVMGRRLFKGPGTAHWSRPAGVVIGSGLVAGVTILVVPNWSLGEASSLVLFAGSGYLASSRNQGAGWPLSFYYLRSILLAVVVLSLLLYPVLDRGVELKERLRMEDAADAFRQEEDPRALLATEQALRAVRSEAASIDLRDGAQVDSLLESALRQSLLSSLGTYEVSLAVLGSDGRVFGRSSASRTAAALARALQQDRADLELMLAIREDRNQEGPVIERITSPVELDRFDYLGVDSLDGGDGWILIRASQHEHLPSGNTPFPRVLVPAGYYGSLFPDLSIAEFRDGVLVRSFGSAFSRSFLDASVSEALERQERVWSRDEILDRIFVTLNVRNRDPAAWQRSEPSLGRSVISVRRPAVNYFDRLYYLLRLTVSGLALALLVYAYGLFSRWRAGELPAKRIRFRDKVLNAFFAVGLVAVVAMGWVGLRVVSGETDRALESWLRQHLDRVEDALALRAGPDDMPYRVLERTDVDSLAAQVGLDLNIYRGVDLESTSRPQLVRDRLISQRIPIEAYNALYVSGFRFASVRENLGRFQYTAGYRALPDEQGMPRYIVSVPTLPEQERIEEERARTAAYLFGALLLLMLVVMVTAAVIANMLARPVARLQRGLQTVAEGRFERIGPVNSRDEIAELVGTFNDMQDQLAESRRLVAQQERQLAWREMARQVAHEIKNPLTPMKLSIQHLKRAFSSDPDGSKFRELFRSKTTTLIEQIDALARIANEFSTFARMPLQRLEPLDLNEVIREAVALMKEHAHVDIQAELSDGPLPVEADREALRRMYINFVKNALEALDESRPGKVRVISGTEVDAETGNTWAISAVVDNGTGIPEGLRDRVFNPSFSTKTSGTGLGLAIARNTVEELGGRIGFETEEGEGTTIWVRIPLMLTHGAIG